MGWCCSYCCGGNSDGDDDNDKATQLSSAEIELQAQQAEKDLKSLSIARGMSAPTIELIDRVKISGRGLALTAVVLEQDAAYWEVHVEQQQQVSESAQDSTNAKKEMTKCNAMFGVATKKDRQFYNTLEAFGDEDAVPPETNGTNFMSTIPVSHGDVVGIILQQSDLPMLQFMLNGEQLYSTYINRFRGVVYPSLLLPNDNTEDENNFTLRIVFKESEFRNAPPSSRFIPVMVARGLV